MKDFLIETITTNTILAGAVEIKCMKAACGSKGLDRIRI